MLTQVILALGDYLSVQCHACIGGTNIGEDIRKLDYGQHIVSGTPGRVFGTSSQLAPSGGLRAGWWHVVQLCLVSVVIFYVSLSLSVFLSLHAHLDMIKRRNLRTRTIKLFILDEADEMLNKGVNSTLVLISRNLFSIPLLVTWFHRFQRANIRRLSLSSTGNTGVDQFYIHQRLE